MQTLGRLAALNRLFLWVALLGLVVFVLGVFTTLAIDTDSATGVLDALDWVGETGQDYIGLVWLIALGLMFLSGLVGLGVTLWQRLKATQLPTWIFYVWLSTLVILVPALVGGSGIFEVILVLVFFAFLLTGLIGSAIVLFVPSKVKVDPEPAKSVALSIVPGVLALIGSVYLVFSIIAAASFFGRSGQDNIELALAAAAEGNCGAEFDQYLEPSLRAELGGEGMSRLCNDLMPVGQAVEPSSATSTVELESSDSGSSTYIVETEGAIHRFSVDELTFGSRIRNVTGPLVN